MSPLIDQIYIYIYLISDLYGYKKLILILYLKNHLEGTLFTRKGDGINIY